MTKSESLFDRASRYIPGGVNSPVRAFNFVGGKPPFIKSGHGAYIYDVDGNAYLDFVNSWGVMILGHNHPVILESVERACKDGLSFGAVTEREVVLAELICELIPSIEMIRMVNSGTEAVMSAIRLARGYTRRNKIVKFSGCYHGHMDAMLVKAGSGVLNNGLPDSAGIPEGCSGDTLVAEYNNYESLESLFQCFDEDIAAVIIEPVAANMGIVVPDIDYLMKVREICTRHSALLIFDEVITGFRLGITGAQGYFGIQPDITALGKIIGGGMPVGAFGGRKEIMKLLAPIGPVYQAGTLSGNPIAMAAGIAQLEFLKNHIYIYEELNSLGDNFYNGIKELVSKNQKSYKVNHIGSLGCLYFTEEPVTTYENAKKSDTKSYGRYFNFMIGNGIYMAPSQFEAIFLSASHTKENVGRVLELMDEYFIS